MSLTVVINGQSRSFDGIETPPTLAELIAELELKGDRIAVEQNGSIAERGRWSQMRVEPGDRLEIVHFVGGGCGNPFTSSTNGYWVYVLCPARACHEREGPSCSGVKGLPDRIKRA